MGKLFIALSAASGFLGVALGAFGAHGLESLLEPERLSTYQTGVEYHLYHSSVLLGVGILALKYPEAKTLQVTGILIVSGIVIFSGSLYLLAITGTGWLGAITPIGGVALLAGWATLLRFAWTVKSGTGG